MLLTVTCSLLFSLYNFLFTFFLLPFSLFPLTTSPRWIRILFSSSYFFLYTWVMFFDNYNYNYYYHYNNNNNNKLQLSFPFYFILFQLCVNAENSKSNAQWIKITGKNYSFSHYKWPLYKYKLTLTLMTTTTSTETRRRRKRRVKKIRTKWSRRGKEKGKKTFTDSILNEFILVHQSPVTV